MSANMMKIVGIITMILAHPIGYRLWNAILWTPFIYGGNTSGYTEVELAIYVGVGILEIFFVPYTPIVFCMTEIKNVNIKQKNGTIPEFM